MTKTEGTCLKKDEFLPFFDWLYKETRILCEFLLKIRIKSA